MRLTHSQLRSFLPFPFPPKLTLAHAAKLEALAEEAFRKAKEVGRSARMIADEVSYCRTVRHVCACVFAHVVALVLVPRIKASRTCGFLRTLRYVYASPLPSPWHTPAHRPAANAAPPPSHLYLHCIHQLCPCPTSACPSPSPSSGSG